MRFFVYFGIGRTSKSRNLSVYVMLSSLQLQNILTVGRVPNYQEDELYVIKI
jgi:hypothetical protein